MAGMFDYSPGLAALSSGLDSIGTLFDNYRKQQDQQRLAEAIQSGDLTGAAQSAFAAGNPYVGLQLYGLAQKKEAATGLGKDLENIQKIGAPATVLPGKVSMAAPGDAMAYAPAIDAGETNATDPSAYSKVGIVIPKTGDRAYGKHQVMGANIGPWTKEALGTAMTPEQFLASPEAQDAVFKNKFGQYVAKYGPEGAAKAWFAGEGGMNNPNAADPLGTTVASYAAGFNRRLGQPPALAAIDAATGGAAPDGTPITLAAGKRPSPVSPDGSEEPSGPRPLGQPLEIPDNSDEVNALIAKRDAYIRLLPKAEAAGQTAAVTASISALNEQITAARGRSAPYERERDLRIQRRSEAEGLGFKPGSPGWRHMITTGKDPTEQRVTVKDPYGNDVVLQYNPDTGNYDKPIKAPADPNAPDQPDVPLGVNKTEYLKKRADAVVKSQELEVASKKIADIANPAIEDAISAYKELKDAGGLGPAASSPPNRLIGKYTPLGQSNEALRQKYELALAKLNLVLKPLAGQGQVSNYERTLASAQFPGLDLLNPDQGLKVLNDLKKELSGASHTVTTGYENMKSSGKVTHKGYTIEQVGD